MGKHIFLLMCISIVCSIFTISCIKETNFHNENLNDFICGVWNIENDSIHEEIEFFEEGYFILNEEIFGNYWVNEDDTNDISYICENEYDISVMKLKNANLDHDILTIENLPKHPGERKIIKKIKIN